MEFTFDSETLVHNLKKYKKKLQEIFDEKKEDSLRHIFYTAEEFLPIAVDIMNNEYSGFDFSSSDPFMSGSEAVQDVINENNLEHRLSALGGLSYRRDCIEFCNMKIKGKRYSQAVTVYYVVSGSKEICDLIHCIDMMLKEIPKIPSTVISNEEEIKKIREMENLIDSGVDYLL
jgi:hypothetical protein